MVTLQEWINRAVTWIVIIDPVGTLPLFLALTRSLKAPERARVARKSILIAGLVLLGYVALGQLLLNALGVSLSAFRLAGGIILFLIGLKMVFDTQNPNGSLQSEPGHDISVFPLAIPSIAGPAAVMAAIVTTDSKFGLSQQIANVALMIGVLGLTYVLFRFGSTVQKWIGETGGNVISRVMGMILCALAVQSVIEALQIMLAMHASGGTP